MPTFRHTERPCLVLNSLKVMYSTLCAVPQLRHCSLHAALLGALLARPRLEAYWVVRDPYQRLQSCFRDKFRAFPQVEGERKSYPVEGERKSYPLQMDLLSIREHGHMGRFDLMPVDELWRRCRELEFEDFITVLPECWHINRHFWPQHLEAHPALLHRQRLRYAALPAWSWRRLGRLLVALAYPDRFPRVELRVLRMENAGDIALLGRAIGYDLSSLKLCSTAHLQVDTRYSRRTLAIVNELYREDFRRLGYAMRNGPGQREAASAGAGA